MPRIRPAVRVETPPLEAAGAPIRRAFGFDHEDRMWRAPPPGVTVIRNEGPGAWTEKWKSPKTGRWVHNYTRAHFVDRAGEKFADNLALARRLPEIRRRYGEDLLRRDRRGVIALVVALIDRAYFRVGNEVSAERGAFGVTTLLGRHLRIEGDTAVFEYLGKKKVAQKQIVGDALIVARLSKLVAGPEERVFRHDDRPIEAEEINAYLAPFELTAKQFRTFHATRIARRVLLEAEPEDGAAVERAYAAAAAELGNTPAVCRQHYVDPMVIDAFERGALR